MLFLLLSRDSISSGYTLRDSTIITKTNETNVCALNCPKVAFSE
jgi:hypothetical protein